MGKRVFFVMMMSYMSVIFYINLKDEVMSAFTLGFK